MVQWRNGTERGDGAPGAVIAAWCFQCGLDYAADVAECVECGIPTVDHPPSPPERLAAADAPQLAYELHAWNGPARAAVENELHRANLLHTWQGPTLLVLESDEDAVDTIIGDIDDGMATAAEGVHTEGGRIGFDLGARNQELHRVVTDKLTEEGIDHELMGNGYLLVPTELEDTVGDWIEEIQERLRASSTFGKGLDGVDSHAVVEALFLASDTLRRNTRDGRAQRQLLENESLARDLKLPFGYEAPMWRSVLDQAAVLVALIEDSADDNLVEIEAAALRDMLHPYV